MPKSQSIARNSTRYVWSVLVHFYRNQGLLLAGAVAYYTLLSIIPLLGLSLIGLSHIIEEARLIEALGTYLELVVPGHSADLVEALEQVLAQRSTVTGFGVAVLLFFSTFAFSILENAMQVIFHHRRESHSRHFMVSLIIPYVFMCFLSFGLLVITVVSGALHWMGDRVIQVFGFTVGLNGASGNLLYLIGIGGLVLVFTAIYMVFPVGHIRFKHALLGGATAALLWEITRHILVWYYATLSMVQVVYGTFATAVVFLLTFEIGAIILLLGAQVIADADRRAIQRSRASLRS